MRTGSHVKYSLCGLMLACFAVSAHAQFKLQQTFEGTTAPGWTLTNSAILTAPSIDPAGSGWLRLTGAVNTAQGQALNSAFSFGGDQPVSVEFSYVSWGGTGADGLTLFLYDSSVASPMSGALTGGGLGYCGGAGGYLAIGIDEYGNFSNPGDKCKAASGGPGFRPESMVIRGPISATNPWITTASVPGGIDNPHAVARPSPKTVLFTLTPAVAPAVGYTISAQFQSASGQPFQTLFSNVAFPYAPPANLSVGISGSTGGSTNAHELQGLAAATPDDLQVMMSGPASVLQGGAVTYTVTLTNNGNQSVGGVDAPTFLDTLPASVTAAAWSCVAANGASCDPSGSGNINTANLSLPPNSSVSFSITGTLDPNAVCGTTVGNTARADFSSTTKFLDPDETNNAATVNSTVTCNTTLAVNPGSLIFAPQTVNLSSGSQSVTVTEGMNSATITSITASGDYSQTNDCPSTLSAGQTCTISVLFTPTAQGSRGGSVTIVSNAAASPPVTSLVSLSGTGTNAAPNSFSFTPLIDVYPASIQVSNAITVANTNVPSPISVSAGAQYSINGGAFTATAGVVSPGAQVQVQLTAASGYSTSDSAILTIGGVSSTFTVTTAAQPVLQGGFTPINGATPSSVQTSNPVTVTAITAPAQISVSSGAQYSINGGAFTSADGVVQPGDQVTVQTNAASTYNTVSSAVLNIEGITSTFTVTTSAQPVLQGGFTPVTGAPLSSLQVSNPITVSGITATAQISVSAGAQYSINGGAFTSDPGVVQPGDQVRVEITSPSAYSTQASAVLDIAGISSTFSVTTAAQPVLQGSFAPVTAAAPGSIQTSNAITVTGITAPAQVTISGGQYSVNGGPFTSAPGTVQPGDQLRVQVTAPSTYNTTSTVTLDVNGVASIFSVTSGAQLENIVVKAGGGALGGMMLLALSLLLMARALGLKRSGWVAPVALMLVCTFAGREVQAAEQPESGFWSNVYAGVRIGGSSSSMNAEKLTRGLRAEGYSVTAANAERASASGTLYVGYELGLGFAAELSGTYVGRTRAELAGVAPADLHQLLADSAHIVRGAGDIVALEGRYRWHVLTPLAIDLRAGPYLWITKTDVYVNGVDQLSRTDTGGGFTAGVAPRIALGHRIAVGASVDFFRSTHENHFVQYTATLEYRFR